MGGPRNRLGGSAAAAFDPRNNRGDEPARLAHLDDRDERGFVVQAGGGSAQIVPLRHRAFPGLSPAAIVLQPCRPPHSVFNRRTPMAAFQSLLGLTTHYAPSVFSLSVVVIMLGLVYYISLYTRFFLADVMFWAMRNEKDQRFAKSKEIIGAAEMTILHVLRDDRCKRLAVMGHSLGSAIAYDALIRLGRRLAARQCLSERLGEEVRLRKISHLITIGSPIDRIHYFFDLTESAYHRYNRIQDRFLGSTASMPFRYGNDKGVQWINMWDDVDPISSQLYSPRHSLPNEKDIMNVHCASSFRPDPFSAHIKYFYIPVVMQVIFWTAAFGRLPRSLPSLSNSIRSKLDTLRLSFFMFVMSFVWIFGFAAVGVYQYGLYRFPRLLSR